MRGTWLGVIAAVVMGLAGCADAQAINQSGAVVPFHVGAWFRNGVLADGGTVQVPFVDALGMFNGPSCPFGISSQTTPGQSTAAHSEFSICQTAAATTLNFLGVNGGATPSVYFNVGGTLYPFPGPGNGDVLGPLSTTTGDIACYASTSGTLLADCATALVNVNSYGADPTGVADSTAAWQAAIDSGKPFGCNGVYKTTATLTISALASQGMSITGNGPTGQNASTLANRCVIRPSSAVTVALKIDGVGRSGYVNGVTISGLTLDMTNMAAGTKGFVQGQSFDIAYRQVRVQNDTAKFSWYFGPGAFVTYLDTVQGNSVSCIGNGTQNPTTLLISNPDILQVSQEQCANVTLSGGAVQASYNAGQTTVDYISPGNTNLLGFYPTTQALWAATGGTPAGMYVALSNYTLNAQNLTSSGTDFEVLNLPPATCSIAGSTWAFGTYDDGTHGCLPVVWGFSIGPVTHGCSFDNPVFAGEYLWTPNNPTCSVRGYYVSDANQQRNILPNYSDFTGRMSLLNSQAFIGYSDLAMSNATFTLDASNGGLAVQTEGVQAVTDNLNFVTWSNHEGQLIGGVAAQTPVANSSLFITNGTSFVAYDALNAARVQISGATGTVLGNQIKAQPATDAAANAFLIINVGGTAQTLNCGTAAAAPIGDSGCNFGAGANTNWFSDGFTTKVATVNGTTGAILSKSTGGVGYGTGAGGAVTQITSRATGVEVDKPTGAITLFSAAGTASYQSFTVTNSTVAATDTIVLNQRAGTDKYILLVTAVTGGSFNITFATTGGTTTEQPVISFAVIKGSAS